MLEYIILVLLVILIYMKVYKPNQYWRESGVPHIKPYPIVGTMGSIIWRRTTITDATIQMYQKFDERYNDNKCIKFTCEIISLIIFALFDTSI